MKDHRFLRHGIRIGGTVGGFLLILFYVLAAPTDDIRARIPFILQGPVAVLVVTSVIATAGVIGLAITRTWNIRSIPGVLISAVFTTFLLWTGVIGRVIPQIESQSSQWIMVTAAAVIFALVLVWERREWISDNGR